MVMPDMKNIARRAYSAAPVILLIALLMALLAYSSALKRFAGPPEMARAQTSNLGAFTGYAWSDNLGWISMSGTNYQVVVQSGGTLAGYAWANPSDDVSASNNIGWISFNKSTDFPTACGPQATLSGTTITGWAKVLSADNNGWDGCISLNGTGYGVTLNSTGSSQSGTLAGYAWADNNVGGWISFNCATGGPTGNNVCATSNYAATYSTTAPPPPAITITTFKANPPRVRRGSASSLLYNVTVTNGTTCSISGSNGSSYAVTADGIQHSIPISNVTTNTLYTLACGASTATASIGPQPVYKEI